MTIQDTSSLIVQECPTCGVRHAIPHSLNNEALNNRGNLGKRIYCPNGHYWFYRGKSDADRERELREATQRRLEQAAAERDQFLRSLRSTRGQVTKLRKRFGLEAANG